jgi:hypothetical protein
MVISLLTSIRMKLIMTFPGLNVAIGLLSVDAQFALVKAPQYSMLQAQPSSKS